jgi:hypothetical protein
MKWSKSDNKSTRLATQYHCLSNDISVTRSFEKKNITKQTKSQNISFVADLKTKL